MQDRVTPCLHEEVVTLSLGQSLRIDAERVGRSQSLVVVDKAEGLVDGQHVGGATRRRRSTGGDHTLRRDRDLRRREVGQRKVLELQHDSQGGSRQRLDAIPYLLAHRGTGTSGDIRVTTVGGGDGVSADGESASGRRVGSDPTPVYGTSAEGGRAVLEGYRAACITGPSHRRGKRHGLADDGRRDRGCDGNGARCFGDGEALGDTRCGVVVAVARLVRIDGAGPGADDGDGAAGDGADSGGGATETDREPGAGRGIAADVEGGISVGLREAGGQGEGDRQQSSFPYAYAGYAYTCAPGEGGGFARLRG